MEMNWKLDPDFKARWVAALRSCDFKQGHNRLLDFDNNYCCLGVACIVSGYHPDKIINKAMPSCEMVAKWFNVETEKLISMFNCADDFHEKIFFTVTVIDKKTGEEYKSQLTTLNDSGYSFIEIADLIENQL